MAAEKYDVIVVGSGAGGGAAAWQLAERGLRVLLLEAGPAYDPLKDYLLDRNYWELGRFPEKISMRDRQTFAPLQLLDPAGDDLRSWNRLHGRLVSGDRRVVWGHNHVMGLGGTTLRYTGEAHRMNPQAMQMRTRFGVAADWPLSYDDLEPDYQLAEKLIGVAGKNGDKLRWRSEPFPLPAHPLSYASQRLVDGAAKLQMRMVANSRAALSRPYDGRPPCNYCGQCNRGCPRLDKGSVDVTFLRQPAIARNCTIKTGCEVLRVRVRGNDRVSGVLYATPDGAQRFVAARAVVVAAGAIETPRLLLNSQDKTAPDGLANESGEVGRNFLETLGWTSTAEHPDKLGSHRGLPADAIIWDYNAPDAISDVIGGCRFVNSVLESDIAGPVNTAKRAVGGWGKSHKEAMRASFGHLLGVGSMGETLPHPDAFVALDPEAEDAHGLPRARIHTHLDDHAQKRLRFMAETCRAILKASGAEQLVEEYGAWDNFNSSHLFGTCRMGADPETSVVDDKGRSHRWRNLFITDASVFPSSGGGESPALTISALAIRSARHISELAGRGEL